MLNPEFIISIQREKLEALKAIDPKPDQAPKNPEPKKEESAPSLKK